MLCSGTELGLNEDLYPGAGYNGLLVLPEDAEIGSDVKELTGLNDWIFDVSITQTVRTARVFSVWQERLPPHWASRSRHRHWITLRQKLRKKAST